MLQRHLVAPSNTAAAVPLHEQANLKEQTQPILDFFQAKTCYEFLPNSTQTLCIDVELPLRDALTVAVENMTTFATLWDSQKQRLCGMMTVTDYVKILLHFHAHPQGLELDHFWAQPVQQWRDQRPVKHKRANDAIVAITVNETLLQAVSLMQENKIHRLPVIHQNTPIHVLSLPPLLSYFVSLHPLTSPLFSYSLRDLKVGTFRDAGKPIHTGTPQTPLHVLLSDCMRHTVSVLPIVDEEGHLVDLFSRYDVMYIAQEAEYNLNVTLADISACLPKTPIFTCSKTTTFGAALQHLATSGARRLVCVDEANHVDGVVSVGDVFRFFYYFYTEGQIPPSPTSETSLPSPQPNEEKEQVKQDKPAVSAAAEEHTAQEPFPVAEAPAAAGHATPAEAVAPEPSA
eukprot:TRINITY_DN9243_c0_g1_i1.p1 TRINITY_DN9243_c0_g1~~TRINITY_DN9243_c0_g1_i1.p1  ORF type:complete len:401 (+),score=79.74 TRINITY_DN9243_c0_g1_i1:188-1390(+)